MSFRKKIADRLEDRNSAIEKKKMLLAKLCVYSKNHLAVVEDKKPTPEQVIPEITVQEPAAEQLHVGVQPRLVVIEENGAIPMYVEGQRSRQHLSPAMRKLADVCLDAAQNRSRNVVILWPGNLECLPFAHVLASIEKWAKGYKRGLRTVFYPATQSSFNPLNHIKADREVIHEITNKVFESSFNGANPEVKESCPEKDLMLFSLNSLGAKAKESDLQPCLNELLPHFYLATGNKKELTGQNYASHFLNHLITKLASRGHTKSLRQDTLPYLGNPQTAPDAIFGLSHQMKKDVLASALRNINGVGAPELVIIDATQSAFRRTENLRNRITAFIRLVDETFKPAPGIIMVTDDPQQMVQLRASLGREVDAGHIRRFLPTQGLCHPFRNKGLEPQVPQEIPSKRPTITIKVAVTDKESAKLIDQAYRYRGVLQDYKDTAAALGEASSFLRTMSNLPSSPLLLHSWLDDLLAEPQQRRHYDWLAYKNKLKHALDAEIPTELRSKLVLWLNHMDKVIESYDSGTPLAFAMANRISDYAKHKYRTLVVLASPFYVMLAEQFFSNYGDCGSIQNCVRFVAACNAKEEIHKAWAGRIIVSFMNADILRLIMTDKHVPANVDFLLTQNTATYVYHSLKPVLDFPEFAPYHPRAKAIIDQLSRIKLEGGGVLPPGDIEPPVFNSTLPPRERMENGDAVGDRDMVRITVDDGHVLCRGLHSVIYVYDPAARESHDRGFRPEHAENLSVGERIFVMSDELHDLVEGVFLNAGVNLVSDSKFERLLRLYHCQVLESSKKLYPGSVAERARGIREAMSKAHPVLTEDLNNIRYWIDLDEASDKPFDQLMPQAPRNFEHFQAFLEALGFEGDPIKLFWSTIQRVRGDRIIDGLNFGDHYSRVLFDPSAAAVYDKVPRDALYFLREKARDNIHQVTAIVQMVANKEDKK